MEIDYLNEFIVMSRICNYTFAAEVLYISQPTLYKHIKALEEEVGTPLFVKSGRHLKMTECGRLFVPHAERILEEKAQFLKEVREEMEGEAHTLRFGTNYRSAEYLEDFHAQNREYRVLLCSSDNLEEAMSSGECDIAMMALPKEPDRNQYESFLFCSDEVVAVLYHTHPLAHRASISIGELRNENFVGIASNDVLFPTPSFRMSGISELFHPRIVMTAEKGTAAVDLVARGFGISLMFRNAIRAEAAGKVTLIALNPEVRCGVYVCWRKDTRLTEAALKFIEFVKNSTR